ncbi:MAG TPA: hypothetical protein VHC69_21740 [Polyangiaceae bacterium]|nr:hypothetical protein [Polyangiaceae bacterium]
MKTQTLGSIIVGRPDVDPRSPSHVAGIHEGNLPARRRPMGGANGGAVPTEATRSTGINPKARLPVDPRMPRLPPA